MKHAIILSLWGLLALGAAQPTKSLPLLKQLEEGVKKSNSEIVKKLLGEKTSLFNDQNSEKIMETKNSLRRLAKQRLVINRQKLICNFSVLTYYIDCILLTAIFSASLGGLYYLKHLLFQYQAIGPIIVNGININEHIIKTLWGIGVAGSLYSLVFSTMMLKKIVNWRSMEQKIVEAQEIKHMLKKF